MTWSGFYLSLKLKSKEALLFKASELILEKSVSGLPIIPPNLILNCHIATDFIKTNFVKKLKIQAAHEQYAHIQGTGLDTYQGILGIVQIDWLKFQLLTNLLR